MRTGPEPWYKELTFSRDHTLLLLRLLTGPDRLGPALRAAMTRRSDHGRRNTGHRTDELPGSRRDAHHGGAQRHPDPPSPGELFASRSTHQREHGANNRESSGQLQGHGPEDLVRGGAEH